MDMEALIDYRSDDSGAESEAEEPAPKRARLQAPGCAWDMHIHATSNHGSPNRAAASPAATPAAAACRPAAAAPPPLLPPADALLDGSYSPPPAAAQRALHQAVLHQASTAAAWPSWQTGALVRTPAHAAPFRCAGDHHHSHLLFAMQGRERAFPHVTGSFATHVYLEGAHEAPCTALARPLRTEEGSGPVPGRMALAGVQISIEARGTLLLKLPLPLLLSTHLQCPRRPAALVR